MLLCRYEIVSHAVCCMQALATQSVSYAVSCMQAHSTQSVSHAVSGMEAHSTQIVSHAICSIQAQQSDSVTCSLLYAGMRHPDCATCCLFYAELEAQIMPFATCMQACGTPPVPSAIYCIQEGSMSCVMCSHMQMQNSNCAKCCLLWVEM